MVNATIIPCLFLSSLLSFTSASYQQFKIIIVIIIRRTAASVKRNKEFMYEKMNDDD
jgi:hypothetical protein